MRLHDFAVLYLLAGLGAAVFIYRDAAATGASGARRLLSAALAVPLWPLWAPIALSGRAPDQRVDARPSSIGGATEDATFPVHRSPSSAEARIEVALREGAAACAGTPMEHLFPREAAARITADVRSAVRRHAELEAQLQRPELDLAAAEARVRDLSASSAGSNTRALATATRHRDNIRRLIALRDRDAQAIEEIVDLAQTLRGQLLLDRHARSFIGAEGDIVAELCARVEGLGAVMTLDENAL